MPKFPEPPPPTVLAAVPPTWGALPARTEIWCIYYRGGPFPTAWNAFRTYGPLDARFDHHLPPPRAQERAILYGAAHIATCLAEVFQPARVIAATTNEPWLVGFASARPLQLLDLSGVWPTAAGASMAINSGPRARARRWSQAIYAAYPEADGLCYASSMHANQPAVALYERAANTLPPAPFFHRALADPLLLDPLRHAAHALGYALVIRDG